MDAMTLLHQQHLHHHCFSLLQQLQPTVLTNSVRPHLTMVLSVVEAAMAALALRAAWDERQSMGCCG
jgi:hypothetical protein